ncbi:hypothetical protein F3Y22_tig00016725pilonHSYRG00012 [Hibiscus syriacus]|uniref:Uncharacterized protein n=1 Tax=Hibiscus syriacus TaxID=106335 RepID=A0A6A3BWX2_HIBSY|nr:hypothetical protein F3Y22_tig00016725pilonHSYRG00012 [Hibiscus syriacus]
MKRFVFYVMKGLRLLVQVSLLSMMILFYIPFILSGRFWEGSPDYGAARISERLKKFVHDNLNH